MLDIALIRRQPDEVKEGLARLHDPEAVQRVDRILELDARRRELLSVAERLQMQRKRTNSVMGAWQRQGHLTTNQETQLFLVLDAAGAVSEGRWENVLDILDPASRTIGPDEFYLPDKDPLKAEVVAALRGMSTRYNELLQEIRATEAELGAEMLWLPNLPHASVPVAASEDDNRPRPPQGDFREFDFQPLPHWDLGPALGVIDLERGVKIAGSRGYVLRGDGARLQQALINFFLDRARADGYEQFYVPLLVPAEMLVGAGQFPKFEDTVYREKHGGRYLLPTAEVALTNLHRDEILDEGDLPLKYVAHSPCFRREHMSAGRDTRGIKRVHQFEKVERFLFTTPEESYAALETLTEAAEDLCRALELPCRLLEIVTGDLGFSASKKYDVEVYAPGSDEWLEASSCSNTEAFQARRANIRFRREGVRRPLPVHTLNGSALALPRVIIAILENNQNADGSVDLPEVLVDYMGGQRVIHSQQE